MNWTLLPILHNIPGYREESYRCEPWLVKITYTHAGQLIARLWHDDDDSIANSDEYFREPANIKDFDGFAAAAFIRFERFIEKGKPPANQGHR
jgi:hypothetical protein